MKIISIGDSYDTQESEITCGRCKSVIAVRNSEWKYGTYGSEQVCKCPVCENEIVRPGTEYQGDF